MSTPHEADKARLHPAARSSPTSSTISAPSDSAIARLMYPALNHVLFNPVMPYELYALKDTPEPMLGTAQRLARRVRLIGQSVGRQAPSTRPSRRSRWDRRRPWRKQQSNLVAVRRCPSCRPRQHLNPCLRASAQAQERFGKEVPLAARPRRGRGVRLGAERAQPPLGSYLESNKGKRCVVFLVNGQRQEFLDNSFIVQDLGFKYLRARMMIAVDVDGLAPEAIGKMMQGSRQGFYRGHIFDAITKRIVATLKNDPDLVRLEEEAEEAVSELSAGDEKVKQTLDQLIEFAPRTWPRLRGGRRSAGDAQNSDELGFKTVVKDGVVTLLPPDSGAAADYPGAVVRICERPSAPQSGARDQREGDPVRALAGRDAVQCRERSRRARTRRQEGEARRPRQADAAVHRAGGL